MLLCWLFLLLRGDRVSPEIIICPQAAATPPPPRSETRSRWSVAWLHSQKMPCWGLISFFISLQREIMMAHGWFLTSSQLTALSPLSLLIGASTVVLVPVCSRRGSYLQAMWLRGWRPAPFFQQIPSNLKPSIQISRSVTRSDPLL